MTTNNRDLFREALAQAEKKAETRRQRGVARQVKLAKEIVIPVKQQTQKGGKEPSLLALQNWTSAEYLEVFTTEVTQVVPRYEDAKKIVSLSAMKEFLATLTEYGACPRSKLDVVRAAAKRMIRYKKKFRLKASPRPWMLRTYAHEIINDLVGLVYDDTSLRYICTEHIEVDILKVQSDKNEWIISWDGHQARLPVIHLSQVTNPFLLEKLNQPLPQETLPDDDDYHNWTD